MRRKDVSGASARALIAASVITFLCTLSLASAASPSPLENAYISVIGAHGDGFSITGLNGIFNLTQGLGTGNYTVEIRRTGYISRMLDTTIVAGAETDLGDIGLAISGNIEGVVQDLDGNPISNVSVACKDESNNHAVGYAVTSIDGSFSFDTDIKNGTYTVEALVFSDSGGATHPGYSSNATSGIEGFEGQTTSGVIVQLKPSGTILGTVKDTSNVPIENVSIAAIPEYGSGALRYGGFAKTDSQGAYSIDSNLLAGTYKVSVTDARGFVYQYRTSSGYWDYQNATVIAGLNTTINFTLEHSGIISGAVSVTGGAPAPNVGVFAVCLAQPHTVKYFGGGTTDSAGLYSIDSLLGTGEYRVFAGNDFYNMKIVNVTAGEETPNVDFQITKRALAWITGTVTNSTASHLLSAELKATGEGISAISHTEGNGTYIMEIELPEGQNSARLNLTASANGYASLSQNVTVNLEQTTSNVDFTLQTIESGTLTGRVIALIPDAVPPTITGVTQTPSQGNVLPQDIVVVNAKVTDDVTGVKEVALSYTTGNGTWITSAMSNLGGNEWTASIPSFQLGTNVTYIIMAEDNSGNLVSTLGTTYENNYLVIPEFTILTIFLPSCAISSVLAIILQRKSASASL